VKNIHAINFMTIENTAGWFYDLAIPTTLEFTWLWTTLWMICELPDMLEDSVHPFFGGGWILQCDVVGNCVKV